MTDDSKKPKRRRRWLRFSLRGLLVLVLLISMPMAWIANKVNALRPQLEAAKRIVERGGAVRYEPAKPEWIARIVGEENFRRVTEVQFGFVARSTARRGEAQPRRRKLLQQMLFQAQRAGNTQQISQIRDHIAELPAPEQGWGYRSKGEFPAEWQLPPVTDKEFEDVAALVNVTRLTAWRADLSSDGLRSLQNLSQLEYLDLRYVPIGDESVPRLSHLTKLRVIRLNRTDIDDKALVSLAELADLKTLLLSGNERITGSGLAHLSASQKLSVLHLGETGLKDEGLAEVGKFKALETLGISNTKTTDAGLERLHGLTNLRHLHVRGTKVTDAGIQRLQVALPNVKVHR